MEGYVGRYIGPYRIDGAEAWDAALFEDLIERVADPDGATGRDAQQVGYSDRTGSLTGPRIRRRCGDRTSRLRLAGTPARPPGKK